MAIDFNQPTNSTTYTSHFQYLRDNIVAGLKMDYTAASNIPTNAIRWNSTDKKFEIYNGSAWGDLATYYDITATDLEGLTATIPELNNAAAMPVTDTDTIFSVTVPTTAASLDTWNIGAVTAGDIFIVQLVIQGGTKGGTSGQNFAMLSLDSSATCTLKTGQSTQFIDRRELDAGSIYSATIQAILEIGTGGNLVVRFYGNSAGSTTINCTGYLSYVQLKNV